MRSDECVPMPAESSKTVGLKFAWSFIVSFKAAKSIYKILHLDMSHEFTFFAATGYPST